MTQDSEMASEQDTSDSNAVVLLSAVKLEDKNKKKESEKTVTLVILDDEIVNGDEANGQAAVLSGDTAGASRERPTLLFLNDVRNRAARKPFLTDKSRRHRSGKC